MTEPGQQVYDLLDELIEDERIVGASRVEALRRWVDDARRKLGDGEPCPDDGDELDGEPAGESVEFHDLRGLIQDGLRAHYGDPALEVLSVERRGDGDGVYGTLRFSLDVESHTGGEVLKFSWPNDDEPELEDDES